MTCQQHKYCKWKKGFEVYFAGDNKKNLPKRVKSLSKSSKSNKYKNPENILPDKFEHWSLQIKMQLYKMFGSKFQLL